MTTDAAALNGNHHGTANGSVNETSSRDGSPPASKHHKRTYQACEPCRNRKVRCDLGSVDAPSDPPCLRCRREKKHCYFTETRRKRKAGESGGPELGVNGADLRRDSAFPGGFVQRTDSFDEVGLYQKQSASHGIARSSMPSTIIRPEGRGKGDGDEVRNHAAAALFKQPIHQPGDALRLLVDAASRTEAAAAAAAEQPDQPLPPKVEGEKQPSNIDPAIVKLSDPELIGLDGPEQAKAAAMETWARLRYVRAGWFTPLEGMGYFEYFSSHLSNLTPTPIPDFFDYRNHIKLLKEEPMLTVTLLTVASRYRMLSGPGGASRSIYIHSMLWRECQDMVTRMFWGQEHFGGMFGLASGFRADTGEPVKRGLRGLGTVEALLILSDWHPRSMHFPPASNNDDILAPLQSEWEEANRLIETRNPHQGWTEPAMRSDRMSWSLAGAAYNLSVELGVFDSMPEMGHFKPGYKTRAYDPQRADRIGRLVHIYVSQTSGRLGYPNMLPYNGVDLEDEFFKMRLEPVEDESDPQFQAEQMQRAWCELSAIMRRVNNELFRSKQQTLELIQTNKYIEVLESFWPVLKDWRKRVESINLPDTTRTLIMMEYEYSRTYINSLALQAQIEQYAELQNTDPAAASSESSALFSKTLVEISKKNAPYINEVVDSTRSLLRYVVDHLRPSGGLKHSPVRTIFRILSGAMFLLKTFALGSKESEIHRSLTLLQRTVEALRDTVVDDCHLSLRIADLLDSLIMAIGTKFVRVSINSKQGGSKRRRESLSSRPSAPNATEIQANSPTLGKPPPTSSSTEGANGANGNEMPFGARLVNPNDPNVVIMPPPDYAYNLPEHAYSQHHSPRAATSGGIQNGYPALSFGMSSTAGEASQSQGIPSPTVGSAAGPVHPPMKFSPTPQNQQPFSPMSNGSSNGNTGYSYDWYAVDIHPLVNQAGGNMGNAQAGSVGGSVMAWGNMFGPEIGDGLEMLNVLTADTMPFDDNVGWAA